MLGARRDTREGIQASGSGHVHRRGGWQQEAEGGGTLWEEESTGVHQDSVLPRTGVSISQQLRMILQMLCLTSVLISATAEPMWYCILGSINLEAVALRGRSSPVLKSWPEVYLL